MSILFPEDMIVLKHESAMITFKGEEVTEIFYLTNDSVFQYVEKTITVANDLIEKINDYNGYTDTLQKCAGSQFDPQCVNALYVYLMECSKKVHNRG